MGIKDWLFFNRVAIAWHRDSQWRFWSAQYAFVLELGRLQVAWLRG